MSECIEQRAKRILIPKGAPSAAEKALAHKRVPEQVLNIRSKLQPQSNSKLERVISKSFLAALAVAVSACTTSSMLAQAQPATAQMQTGATNWTPKRAPLMTRFAAQVNPNNPLPEYPRPQLTRTQWMNLNGIWQYQKGNEGDPIPTNTNLSSRICVPFPVESALSGVMERHDRLWYRRQFSVPAAWQGKQLMLHFGAVDYETEVFVNGQSAGIHRGGYEPFSLDISDFVQGQGPQELIVRVFDPTDKGGQPRGKQTLSPGGIMYTPISGIWQTVWLEPVARAHIRGLHMVPDIDKGEIKISVDAGQVDAGATRARITVKDGTKTMRTVTVRPGVETLIPIKNAKLWSPDSPFLYDVSVQLLDGKREVDRVGSYFGMRKISLGKVGGITKILLNNQFVFQNGPLDQGYWPDGLYTAPTDEALRYDLVATKQLGFNMTRKHIKVEPARWYYHADKLGLLVWQDMPSPNSYLSNAPTVDKQAFEKQEENVIKALWNSPSIIMWVLINEGQGAYNEPKFVSIAKRLDPSRLVNRHSGAGNHDAAGGGELGDVDDVHTYPAPQAPNPSPNQAIVCGEYGGIGFPIPGHTWTQGNWGYTTVATPQDLEERYGEYTGMLKRLRDERGMSAAVYTQITDVEVETNGLLTYDRIPKANAQEIARANRFAYPQPTYLAISPTSDQTAQSWKYTNEAPPANWTGLGFNDANWKTGEATFGNQGAQNGPRISTTWESSDIYLRKTFNPGNLSASEIKQFVLRNLHDDELEVFINGVSAFQNNDAVHVLEDRAISQEALNAIVPGANNVLAVHCHNRFGDQHVDVGIYRRVPATRQ